MNEARQGPPRRDSPCAVFPLLRIREAAARGVCEINSCAGRLGLGWGMAYEALHRQPKGTDRLSPRCVPQRITPPAIAQQPMLNLASASATADHQAPVISRSRTHTAKRAQPKRGTAAGRGTNKRTGRGRGDRVTVPECAARPRLAQTRFDGTRAASARPDVFQATRSGTLQADEPGETGGSRQQQQQGYHRS
jgi:hypothetical protein